ncbi:MAG: hypothetical protein WA087_03965 [Candidatus Saccharimonadales bacterium]
MKLRIILFLAFFLVNVALYVFSTEVRGIVIQSLSLVDPVGAALIGLCAAVMYGISNANGRALMFIAAGIACWGIGEIIFMVFANIMNIDPFPSLADVFFLLAYPLLGVGIYQSFVAAEIKLKQVRKSLLATLLSVSFVLAIFVMYFMIYQVYDPEADLAINFVNISYGLGDLVLVILSLLAILVSNEYKGGKLGSFWMTMASGFTLILIADIMFAIYSEQVLNDIKPYTYIDLIWTAGYLFIAFGMLENYLHVSAVQKKIKLKLAQK